MRLTIVLLSKLVSVCDTQWSISRYLSACTHSHLYQNGWSGVCTNTGRKEDHRLKDTRARLLISWYLFFTPTFTSSFSLFICLFVFLFQLYLSHHSSVSRLPTTYLYSSCQFQSWVPPIYLLFSSVFLSINTTTYLLNMPSSLFPFFLFLFC